jgi:hypothetical protein
MKFLLAAILMALPSQGAIIWTWSPIPAAQVGSQIGWGYTLANNSTDGEILAYQSLAVIPPFTLGVFTNLIQNSAPLLNPGESTTLQWDAGAGEGLGTLDLLANASGHDVGEFELTVEFVDGNFEPLDVQSQRGAYDVQVGAAVPEPATVFSMAIALGLIAMSKAVADRRRR